MEAWVPHGEHAREGGCPSGSEPRQRTRTPPPPSSPPVEVSPSVQLRIQGSDELRPLPTQHPWACSTPEQARKGTTESESSSTSQRLEVLLAKGSGCQPGGGRGTRPSPPHQGHASRRPLTWPPRVGTVAHHPRASSTQGPAEARPEALTLTWGRGQPGSAAAAARGHLESVPIGESTHICPVPSLGTEAGGTHSHLQTAGAPPACGWPRGGQAGHEHTGGHCLGGKYLQGLSGTYPSQPAAAAARRAGPQGPCHSRSSCRLGFPATPNRTSGKNFLGITH